ncbi:hypothetical protein DFS33DRAFT_1346643 [Desarmillaria ectypa]|nr:hypothetical protein DFS33DRAFT_1346643 [Desarmillaria ectypa]
MIPILLYTFLFIFVLRGFSLNITVPTQPQPRTNETISVLLVPSSDDPSHFFIVVRKTSPPDAGLPSSIQRVDNFTETRNESVVLKCEGTTRIEAIKISPTQANKNVTFALSQLFHVDQGPTMDVSAPSLSNAFGSATVTSATDPPTASASDTSPSKHDHTAAIIAGVVSSAFLLVLIAASIFIWRYRKRRNIPPSRAFLNELDDKRQHRASSNDHLLNVPPPAYSARISRLPPSISCPWEPRAYDGPQL